MLNIGEEGLAVDQDIRLRIDGYKSLQELQLEAVVPRILVSSLSVFDCSLIAYC